jgi:hypothetical protein
MSKHNHQEVLLNGGRTSEGMLFTDVEPHLRTITPGTTAILFKAKFADSLIDSCDTEANRRYFYALENGYESNRPYFTMLPINSILVMCCLPPCCCFDCEVCSNTVCHGTDHIKRVYYDRGEYDEQDCIHCVGLVSGKARTIPSGSKFPYILPYSLQI